jgi:hypothetical protein
VLEHVIRLGLGLSVVFRLYKTATKRSKPAEFSGLNTTTLLYPIKSSRVDIGGVAG